MKRSERKELRARQNAITLKPFESTNYNIPIRDFTHGLVVTKDQKFVKIMEVSPIPFILKKNDEQNKISDTFAQMLKAAPDELHFKAMSCRTDLSYQIDSVEKCIENEKNERCKSMGYEYRDKLELAQINGVSRKFYISFPYIGPRKSITEESFKQIVYSLENDANRMESMLNSCGNEVISEYPDDPNMDNLKLFYNIYNRDKYIDEPFEEHIKNVYADYTAKAGRTDVPVPIANYIAPQKMNFENRKYLIVNDTYYTFLYITANGYNPVVTTGWLNRFISQDMGVDVDVFLKRLPKENVINSIRRSIGRSVVDMSDSSETSESFEESQTAYASANYLKNGLLAGEDFYNMSIIITVSGTKLSEVADKVERIKKDAKSIDIVLRENMFRAEETFNLVLPCSSWNEYSYTLKKSQRNVLTTGAASTYPFTTFQLISREGLYIADDSNGAPVIINWFDNKIFDNPLIMMTGKPGSGKSVCLQTIALRARVRNILTMILAPEKQDEFERVTNAVGGQFIDINPASDNRINIMEIFPIDETADEKISFINGSSKTKNSLLILKITSLKDFFQLHITDMSDIEKDGLQDAIEATYLRFGITEDNDSLWNKEHTAFKEMPILSDLVEELSKKQENNRLTKAISLLTKGDGRHFNGRTNVDINNKFVVFGLEHNSKQMLPLSIFMAMEFCKSKIMEDKTRAKFLMIDEWWKMAFNETAAECTMALSKLVRAFKCSMILATQQLNDILAIDDGKYGLKILNCCDTKILLSLEENDAYTVQELIGITDKEVNMITKFNPGDALLLSKGNRMKIRISPSETEKLITFTDAETLDRYYQMMKQEEAKKQLEEALMSMENLDNKVSNTTIEELEKYIQEAEKGVINGD